MSIEITPASERKCTNIPWIFFSIFLLAITIILVSYCGVIAAKSGELKINIEHKDACGNICGRINSGNSEACGPLDKRNQTKLLISSEPEDDYDDKEPLKCVEKCPEGFEDILNFCLKKDDEGEVFSQDVKTGFDAEAENLKKAWLYILAIAFVAFVFSYVFLVLFRHCAKYVIWIINIGVIVLVFAMAIFGFLVEGGAIIGVMFTITGLLLIGFLFYFRKRIALVAKLFTEASKALMDVPTLIFEPIATFVSLIIAFIIFVIFEIIIMIAEDDQPIFTAAHVFNWISFVFFSFFVIGCQNFIVGGTISKWYFTRDKTKLESPVKVSFMYLLKFHLGSICLGAILITIVKIIKALISYLKNQAREGKNAIVLIIATCLMCFIDIIDQLLQYLVGNAYIIVAKEGTPFIESGKRAYNLLVNRIMDVIALNHFGDFVLVICRLLIVLIAGLVGYTILSGSFDGSIGLPLILGCIIAFLIGHCFVMVFEMTIDTVFLCFCIDCEENDGTTRPYYMSDGLRKVMMEMKEMAGGTLNFGPSAVGEQDPTGIPMLPADPSKPPMYPPLNPGDASGYQPQGLPYPPQPYPNQPQPYPNQPQPYPLYPPSYPPQASN